MEDCKFCNTFVYDDISMENDWRVSMSRDIWDKCYYLDIEHDVFLSDFGSHTFSIGVRLNYCPICGRNLCEVEEDN